MYNNANRSLIALSMVDEKLLDCLSTFKRLKVDQIRRMFSEYGNGLNNRLVTLQRRNYITIDDNGFVQLPANYKIKCSPNEHKVFDLIIHFKDDIDGYFSTDYPFYIVFTMNNAVFDVTIFDDPTTEISQCALINRSMAERVIAIVKDEAHMNRLNIEKQVRYVTVSDEGEVNFLNLADDSSEDDEN